jgi:thiol-disulfide isomerase/thioredoxin
MREGDVLTAVGGRSVVSASLIDLITSLRRTQLGVDSEATVLRGDKHVLLHSSAVHSEPRYFHLVTALVSAKILLSDLPGIVAGDRLVSIGNQSWSAMTANLLSQGIPLAETRFPSGAKVVAESNARARPVMAKLPIVLHIMSFPPASHPDLLAIILHGVRGGDISVSDVKGHWGLLHFWATWCAPCVKSTPTLMQLSKSGKLRVLQVGFADSMERLRKCADEHHLDNVFAPNPELTRQVGLQGVPYDVLLSPTGQPTMIIEGEIPPDRMKKAVLSYVKQSHR